MSEDTQDRLKAFLQRNKNRITNPQQEKLDTVQSYQTEKSHRIESSKLDTTQSQKSAQNPLSNYISNKTPPQQQFYEKKNLRSEGMSFEHQPVSLFDVIGNNSYGEGYESVRSNTVFNQEPLNSQSAVSYLIGNSPQEKQKDKAEKYLTSDFNSDVALKKDSSNTVLKEENSPKKTQSTSMTPSQSIKQIKTEPNQSPVSQRKSEREQNVQDDSKTLTNTSINKSYREPSHYTEVIIKNTFL